MKRVQFHLEMTGEFTPSEVDTETDTLDLKRLIENRLFPYMYKDSQYVLGDVVSRIHVYDDGTLPAGTPVSQTVEATPPLKLAEQNMIKLCGNKVAIIPIRDPDMIGHIIVPDIAKERVDRGIDVVQATLQAVQLRLRPIVMTSLAFIFGVLPLAFATGAAAESRKTIGWTVFGGMLAATTLAIFVVPVLFVLITKVAYGKRLKRLKQDGDNANE